jgi:hypothetical protein
MGTGTFKQPPPGPKIGPVKEVADLPESKKAELGDLSKLVVNPVDAAPKDITDLPGTVDPQQVNEGVQRLEALSSVLEKAAPDIQEIDPEIAFIEETAEPTTADRQAFLRCVLGNTSYQKTYELFGGAVKINMQDIPPSEVDSIFEQLAKDQQAGAVQTVDDWNTQLDRYRMMWMSQSLQYGTTALTPRAVINSATDKRAALCSFVNNINSSVYYRAVLRIVRIFQRHLDKLMEGALNPDFWVADGPDSPSEPT